jgi:hypothetical protein
MAHRASTNPEGLAFRGAVPGDVVRVVAVEYSPDQQRAVVFVEYNEPPEVGRYELLCERRGGAWVERSGSTVGNATVIWAWTHDDEQQVPLGVKTRWNPPHARWDVPYLAE